MITIIAAVAQNNAIGKNNALLWHLSDDLKRFKLLTQGKTVIMGRRTFYSLPVRPLPNRKNIVISRKEREIEGCETAHSINEALKLCNKDEEVFVIGGENIYSQFLSLADTLHITWVYKEFEADSYFPFIDEKEWNIIEKSSLQHDEKSGLDFAYFTYKRK